MRDKIWTVMLMALFAGGAKATPAFVNAGLGGYSASYNCRYLVAGGCNGASNSPTGYNMMGSANYTSTSATSSLHDTVRGASAHTAAYASPTSYLPELHAYASSDGTYSPALGNINPSLYTGEWSAFADANTWGVQGYQYDGATPFDLVINIRLNSIFSADLSSSLRLGHSAFQIAIFSIEGYDFNRDTFCPMNAAASYACPGVRIYARTEDTLHNTGTVETTLHYLVAQGARFYVGAFLDANVCCGQTVDSSHTLRMAFNDPSLLSSIAVAGVLPLDAEVDEPGGMALLVAGLGLIALIINRRRANAAGTGPDC
ncbi:MAG: hypothetical protein M3Y65_15255 [Pseudomonadota bacterium]|nr:hypothetical protein [Pseudomonadota bacterium]